MTLLCLYIKTFPSFPLYPHLSLHPPTSVMHPLLLIPPLLHPVNGEPQAAVWESREAALKFLQQ